MRRVTTWDPPWRGRLAGAVAAAVALSVGELLSGLFPDVPSLINGVATLVIDNVPPAVKDLAIAWFGTADKLVLGVGIVVVTLLIAAWVGHRLGDRPRLVWSVFMVVGLLAASAAGRSGGLLPALANGAASAAAGAVVLGRLVAGHDRPTDYGKRELLVRSGALLLLAAGAGRLAGLLRQRNRRILSRREDVVLPEAADRVAAVPAGAQVEGASPLLTPNRDFYRVDTAFLGAPVVDVSEWSLTVKGMVGREASFTIEDLFDMPMVERYVTLACVSNEVGGDLVGTAKWLGVPLADLLDLVGLGDGAEQVVGRSVDGFTVGFPVEAVYDGRDALVAVGMNDEPLPLEHGFPARLVVAGLYGYVSATKWLTEIELTTWDGFDAYWVPRGWAKRAPIKIQSRIDVPRAGAVLESGRRMIAGVAWAPNRGVGKVEVEVDGEWREAELGYELSPAAWRQWKLDWEATPGDHVLRVRAVDTEGSIQTGERHPPPPDGATGWHTVSVTVV